MIDIKEHRKHRNILYSLVFILVIMQVVTFIVISLQVSRIQSQTQTDIEQAKKELKENLEGRLNDYNAIYQAEFKDISTDISSQKESFNQEIKLLKSTQNDFSGIIDEAVQGTVGVATDKSIGTGFIIDKNGLVVTNYHVISEATRVSVFTSDKKSLPATVLGFSAEKDVALLKIDGEYKALSLADSDELQVGKKVIAIGNPLGLSFSVTEGIISGLNREGPNGLKEYIQTDVSLNPGNSGGPLLDTTGKVVGINNFKIGNSEGLGFALESNSIKEVVDSITNKITA